MIHPYFKATICLFVALVLFGVQIAQAESSTESERIALEHQIETMQAEQRQLRDEIAIEIDAANKSTSLTKQEKDRLTQLKALLVELDARIESQNKKIKYINSNIQEEPYKSYYLQFAKRIEIEGTKSFPSRKGEKIYGEARLQIEINPDGSLRNAETLTSTDSAIGTAARDLVKRLAPYSAFPKGVPEKRFVIFVQFRYTKDVEAAPTN